MELISYDCYGVISSCGFGSKQGKLSILSTHKSDNASLHHALVASTLTAGKAVHKGILRPRYLTLGSLYVRSWVTQGFLEVQFILPDQSTVFGDRKE